MAYLILVRHGQSEYNAQDKWAGHLDEPLSGLGETQARHAGQAIKRELKGAHIDMAFTSKLRRAERTMALILEELGQDPPVARTIALNERDVGDLAGVTIAHATEKYGEGFTKALRFSYEKRFPNGESLSDIHRRMWPYIEEHVLPMLRRGKNVLIVSHKATLRTLIIALEHIPHEKAPLVGMDNATPRVYEFDKDMHITSVHDIALNNAPTKV